MKLMFEKEKIKTFLPWFSHNYMDVRLIKQYPNLATIKHLCTFNTLGNWKILKNIISAYNKK